MAVNPKRHGSHAGTHVCVSARAQACVGGAYARVCMHARMCKHTQVCMGVHVYTHASARVRTCMCAHMHSRKHARALRAHKPVWQLYAWHTYSRRYGNSAPSRAYRAGTAAAMGNTSPLIPMPRTHVRMQAHARASTAHTLPYALRAHGGLCTQTCTRACICTVMHGTQARFL